MVKSMNVNLQIQEKCREIKAILFDVDGVLTDGGIIYDNNGLEYKRFHVKDGQIIQYLRGFEILTGVITGRDSEVVRKRCKELKIDIDYHGVKDKGEVFEQILLEQGLEAFHVAYVGDDINDLPILTKCGLSVTPADGHYRVQKEVDLVLKAGGGQGALRELADLVLESQGLYQQVIDELKQNNAAF